MIITGQFIFLFIVALFLTVATLLVETTMANKLLGERSAKHTRFILATLLAMVIVGLGISNFQATLTLLVAATGSIALLDRLFCHRRRVLQQHKRPFIVENAYGFFGVLLLVWVIRSFIIQPYRVPTGSLQPTVEPGDFLVVNQFAYGLRFPVINKELLAIGKPKRGDIALFYYPVDPSVVFVKRVIGLPGDHIEFRNKVLYINGREMTQTDLGDGTADEPAVSSNLEAHMPVQIKQEDLDGVKHRIYMVDGNSRLDRDFSIDVPAGSYFMMGDNRDNSEDSRIWGFVPQENLIGKAFAIWMSWDSLQHQPRWQRIGLALK